MINSKSIKRENTASSKYMSVTPKSVIEICLYCPLPKCTKNVCKRFEKERKKLLKQER